MFFRKKLIKEDVLIINSNYYIRKEYSNNYYSWYLVSYFFNTEILEGSVELEREYQKQQKLKTMEKEIIGYKLVKPEYEKVAIEALQLYNKTAYDPFIIAGMISYYLPKIKELGIMDWFEPVYKEKEPIRVGEASIIFIKQIPYHHSKIEVNNVEYSLFELKTLLHLMKKGQIKFLNGGFEDKFTIDLPLLEKIITKLEE